MIWMSFLMVMAGDITLPSGLSMHYADEGKGQVVVLIGGLGSRLEVWDAVAQDLSTSFRVIRPDNRGIGGSGDLAGAYSVDVMADDVAQFMEALKIDRYHVVGISLGSFAAQSLALNHPDRVMRLALLASSPGGAVHVAPDAEVMGFFQTMMALQPEEKARQGLRLALHPDFVAEHPGRFEVMIADSVAHPVPAAVTFRQAMAGVSFDHSMKAGGITVPTLILHGKQDRVVPFANAEKLHALIADSSLVALPNAGHLCIVDQSQRVASELVRFLQRGKE